MFPTGTVIAILFQDGKPESGVPLVEATKTGTVKAVPKRYASHFGGALSV